jgi:hypothetical protein
MCEHHVRGGAVFLARLGGELACWVGVEERLELLGRSRRPDAIPGSRFTGILGRRRHVQQTHRRKRQQRGTQMIFFHRRHSSKPLNANRSNRSVVKAIGRWSYGPMLAFQLAPKAAPT